MATTVELFPNSTIFSPSMYAYIPYVFPIASGVATILAIALTHETGKGTYKNYQN